MVNVIDPNADMALSCIVAKKVICFGAGKRFEYFRKINPKILIIGVIDNYKNQDSLYLDGRLYPIWFPEEATEHIDSGVVIVITSIAMDEIVEQLDGIEEFNGISCYAEVVLDNYIGLNDIQKINLKKLIDKLSQRTYESVLKEKYGEINLTSKIKKFQVWQYFSATNTGGSKAREDIKEIIGNMGYQVINVHCSRGERGTVMAQRSDKLVLSEWLHFLSNVPEQSIVFLQFPAPCETRFPKELMLDMKKEKQLFFVCLIHDVNGLRQLMFSQTRDEEFELIKKISDFLIVHNEAMKQYFEMLGIEKTHLISLKIFDYIYEGAKTEKTFEKSVTIAGNLSVEKSAFLKQLGKLSPLRVHLYGPNFSEEILKEAANVDYAGSFSAEMLAQKLDRGFGLIWDGNSIDTCAGGTGEYLRYNNPHKMSLYLSAGLPIIIWSEAAQAEFVRENQVGIIVDSLYQVNDIINSMSEEDYKNMEKNVTKLSDSLKSGRYTKSAIKKAEEVILKLIGENL